MRLCFALVALTATWHLLPSTAGFGMQDTGPCQDLSPHCPALCASVCNDVQKSPPKSHESYEITDAVAPQQNRTKRMSTQIHESSGKPHGGWVSVPGARPSWLPEWIPWVNGGKPGQNATHSGLPGTCDNLVDGGRQLIESFCPKSCGRCGRNANPLSAGKVYIDAQCAVAKISPSNEPVGLAYE